MRIDFVVPDDAKKILDIYSHYVLNATATFETKVPTLEEFRGRIEKTIQKYPYICVKNDNTILAYAYASPYNARQAYDWTCSLSIYVSKEYCRDGMGSILYSCLIEMLEQMGYTSLLACVTVPNTASERFHKSLKFQQAGHFPAVGFKHDKWLDVKWFILSKDKPEKPLSTPDNIKLFSDTPVCQNIVKKYSILLDR